MSPRVVEPEWLDTLPAADPRAQRSRRELARVNALMANAGIVAARLRAGGVPSSLVDLGAGDGRFTLRFARALGAAPAGARLTLVDRELHLDDHVHRVFAALGWKVEPVRADVLEWLDAERATCGAIVANLFLHHFPDPDLARLLAAAAGRTRRFVACEPRRSGLAGLGARMLGAIGCGPVTRHDAVASVRAGFTGAELTRLWPGEAGWSTEERARGLFSHEFFAERP
jgi:SAM-dependent methyltransferase